MLIQSEGARAGAAVLLRQDFFNKLYNKQQREAETFEEEEEEERGLEIDLDYGEYVEVGIKDEEEEPLDLSMKSFARRRDEHEDTQQPADAPVDLHKPKLPRLELKPNFQIFNFDTTAKKPEVAPAAESTQENKSSFMTEAEVSRLLEPHVKAVLRKFVCTVCDMKFANRLKAVTHVENKHVDCLVYKCPLCRASKVTRLAYESHLRRGHGARPDQHRPLIKAKKKFSVRSAAEAGPASDQAAGAGHTAAAGHCSYDLQFVTFLRHSLAGPALVTGAQWLDSAQDTDQAVFRVTNRETFARRWFAFKVKQQHE